MAIAITSYMLANPLQLFFIDVNTQTPLSGGKLRFYRDADQITQKEVFKYTGTPGNPTFISLGTVITLTAQGTPGDDQGNDILYYYLPYDSEGKWDPYYITVEDINGTQQFTRSAMPFPVDPAGGSTAITGDNYNYINNGQFLLHNNVAADATHVAGEITQPITTIAYGNWTFERPSMSTAKDTVVFTPFQSWVANPESNPRYACTATCITFNPGDGYKDICFTFPDVNMFASDTEQITFTFEATCTGGPFTVSVGYQKFFGTGQPTVSPVIVNNESITSFYQSFSNAFPVGSNLNHPVGTLNDDYIKFFIRLPTGSASNISVTNVSLLIGSYKAVIYTPQSPQEVISRTLAGVMKIPDYSGADVGGVLRLTKTNIDYSGDPDGVVKWYAGKPYTDPNDTSTWKIPFSHWLSNGSKLLTTGTSFEGIPFSRLYNKIGIQWGNGYDYLSAFNSNDNKIRIINNAGGAVNPIVEGPISTGFTITTINTGDTPTFKVKSVYYANGNSSSIMLENEVNATVEDVTNHGSPITLTIIQKGNDFRKELTYIAFTNVPAGGNWFTFQTEVKYYVLFTFNGSGTDPAPSGYTKITVPLVTGDEIFDAVLKTSAVLNQAQLTYITTTAASAMTAGSSLKAYTAGYEGSTGEQIAFYFTKGNAGNDPNIPGFTSVKIPLNGPETDIQVATASCLSMNNAFFQTPDIRYGRVIVGLPITLGVDPDVIYRRSNNPAVFGDQYGTYWYDIIAGHDHQYGFNDVGVGKVITSAGSSDEVNTSVTGRYRNSMLNAGMTAIIKY
ncbi:hypothetical protein UFOVP733_50 [uncultured Caudovirales phage]|uniref:Uncharacterized protein n=1 Tax=uncultured Caudovirales phage TaxID=2100421 RepID=A0A6J5NRP5_9CAUD|nr:hypothetical protein UFOVP733_50 [uncultured Caudovirales phage]CAB5224806.1 hypothetical protein UFOVP743_9 [uncultured Caudovirales phage]